MRDVQSLPFDQYQRYRLVADLIESLAHASGASEGPLRILDVGGRTALLREFLPDVEITLVDVEASDEPGLVLGSGSALPFADESFDVVAAFDTLEHVPPAAREAFVAECRRVCRGYVALVGPYGAPRVEEAEALLRDFLEKRLDWRHRYLQEHHDHGLPDRGAVRAGLESAGCRVAEIGHGNLDRWLVLMCLSMYMEHHPRLREMAPAIYRFYNRSLYASDHAEPVYRHLVLGAVEGRELPDLEALLDAPVAPEGALGEFEELNRALLAFDAEREILEGEITKLHEVATDLRADLAGNVETRATLEEDLAGHREENDELRAEIAKVQAEFTELEQTLELAKSKITALENAAEEHELFAKTLRADLDLHRSEKQGLLDDVADVRAAMAVLETDLEGHREVKTELENRLEEVSLERDVLRDDLAGHKLENDEFRAEVKALEAVRQELSTDLEQHAAESARLLKRIADVERESAEAIAVLEEDLAGHREALEQQTRAAEQVTTDLNQRNEELAGVTAERDALRDERDQLDGELTRTRAMADELRADLEREAKESAAVAAELEQRVTEEQATSATLRQDLEGHRTALQDRARELEEVRASWEESERQGAEVRGALEQDLAGHREALSGLNQELAEARRAFDQSVADGQRTAAEFQAVVDDCRAQIQAHEEVKAELERLLAEHRQVVADLRAALADRWGNAKRAMKWKLEPPS